MSFTVEDGSAVTGANSYLTVAAADTYHTDRNNTSWTASTVTDAVKQAALIEATEYLESHYVWAEGVKYTEDQGLSWPRTGALDRHGFSIDHDEIPQAVQDATAYLALKALTDELGAPLERPMSKVKAGAVEVAWEPHSVEEKRYPLVDGWLTGLVHNARTVTVYLT